jgi:thioredoxin reductase
MTGSGPERNRRASFSRIKERNAQRMEEKMKSGKIRVLFNSNPVEIREKSVILDCAGERQEILNDYVWLFAGGISPNAFLQKAGVKFGVQTIDPPKGV